MNLSLIMLICSAIAFGLGAIPVIRINVNWLCLGAMFYVLSLLL